MKRFLPILTIVWALSLNATPETQGQSAVVPHTADQAVLALLKEDLEAQRRADPISASNRGDRRFDDQLPDLSAAAGHAWAQDAAARLARCKAIDPSSLSPMRRTELAMLSEALQQRIDGEPFKGWEMVVTQISGPQYDLPQMPQTLSFTSDKQLADYAARLEKIPAYLDQAVENLRAGLKRGFTPPIEIMGSAADQALAQGTASVRDGAATHPLYSPFAGRSDALAKRAQKAILEGVAPAYDRFAKFLREEYVPGCRKSLGASKLPDGPAYYNFRIRVESTLDKSAEEIHRIGLSEVKRIRGEMMDAISRTDIGQSSKLTGDALFAEFIGKLRTDSRFYCKTPDELLRAYRNAGKLIDAELPKLFVQMPTLSWGVREMPRFIAPSSPTAYYYPGSLENGVSGTFIANTTLLSQRPLYDVIPLTLHEAVPGHHFQIALSQELKDVPEWRTTTGYTGFVEGWGLYAESLGLEMGDDARSPSNPGGRGLFADPYDDFGRLNFEIWRALRLVVDTGIHAQGWTRDQAISFMESNSALARHNIEREVDRYIAWPGQAVAYKLGELHIKSLRLKAQTALGASFNLRRFHKAVLGRGAVPLNVLTAQIDEWIEQERSFAGGAAPSGAKAP